MKKENLIYIIIIAIIILILGIFLFKNLNNKLDQEVMKCIANKSIIYSSATCSHCKTQKQYLGEYYSLFKVIDCFYEPEICKEAQIPGTPTWIINGVEYPGLKTVKELKSLANC